jgi:hypothetical protein
VEYVRTYCDGEVPTRLSCVNEVGPSTIEDWCRSNQSYGYANENARITEKVYQNTVARDEAVSKVPELTNVEVAKQPISSQNNYLTFTNTNYNTSTIDTKVSEPNFIKFSGTQVNTNTQPIITNINMPSYPVNQVPINANNQIITSVVRPSVSEKVVSGAPMQPNGYISFNPQPSTSSNLVQTTYGS